MATDLDRWVFSLSLRQISASSLQQFPRKSTLKSQIQLSHSIWSVPNSATKGMQAVSNLPISAWLSVVFWQVWNGLHSLNSFGRWVWHRSYWESCICDFSVGMKLKFGEEIEKELMYQDPSPFGWDFQNFCVNSNLKWRRSRLTASKLHALSPSYVYKP